MKNEFQKEEEVEGEDLAVILNTKVAEINEFENKFTSKVRKIFFFYNYLSIIFRLNQRLKNMIIYRTLKDSKSVDYQLRKHIYITLILIHIIVLLLVLLHIFVVN